MITFHQFRLREDYKTATKAFVDQGADPAEVATTIADFRKRQNAYKGDEKNIDWWAKQGWEKFVSTIQAVEDDNYKDQLTLRDDDEWLIVVPLTLATSCFHGTNTDWCVAKPDHQYFAQYFFNNDIVLIYCIQKATKKKWAIATHMDRMGESEYFDKWDGSIGAEGFHHQTGLVAKDIIHLAQDREEEIDRRRQLNKSKDLSYQFNQSLRSGQRNAAVEAWLLRSKSHDSVVAHSLRHAKHAEILRYAEQVIKGRWPEAEPVILSMALGDILEYTQHVLRRRWPEAERIFVKEPYYAQLYAKFVIHGRWPEAESVIATNARHAYTYAYNVIHGRWPEAEPKIMANPEAAVDYARNVIRGRWLDAEPVLMKDPYSAFIYARSILQGRWPEAEPVIQTNREVALAYKRHFGIKTLKSR